MKDIYTIGVRSYDALNQCPIYTNRFVKFDDTTTQYWFVNKNGDKQSPTGKENIKAISTAILTGKILNSLERN